MAWTPSPRHPHTPPLLLYLPLSTQYFSVFCHGDEGFCRVRLYSSKQTGKLTPVLAMGQLHNLGFWSMLVWVIITAVCKLTQRFQHISLSSWQLFEVGNPFYLRYMGKESKPKEVKVVYLSSHEKSVRKRVLLSFTYDLSSCPSYKAA